MQMMFLHESDDPISVYLNCYGGSVPAGLAVIDSINATNLKVPVHTYCIGECVGIAVAILASGRSGHRHAFPLSRLSLYQEWYGVESLWGAQSQDHDERQRLMKLVERALRSRTNLGKLTETEFSSHLTALNFFDPERAKGYGIVDNICGAPLPPPISLEKPGESSSETARPVG